MIIHTKIAATLLMLSLLPATARAQEASGGLDVTVAVPDPVAVPCGDTPLFRSVTINGRGKRQNLSFFAAQNLLKKGQANYSLEVGVAREAYGIESSRFGTGADYPGTGGGVGGGPAVARCATPMA